MLHKLGLVVWYMYRGPYNICTCMIGSLIKDRLFGSMQEDEECVYENTLTYDSSAQGGDKEHCSVGEDVSNMYKNVVIQTELMESQVENDLDEDLELQSELLTCLGCFG